MPRYFFDFKNHLDDTDADGTEFAGVDEARVAAVIFAGAYLKDHPEFIWDGRRISLEVHERDRPVMFVVDIEARVPGEE